MSERSAPPLGVYPRFLWDEAHPSPSSKDIDSRLKAVFDAKIRYVNAGLPCPTNWDVEICDRMDALANVLNLPTLWETFNSLMDPVPQSLFPSDDPQPDHIIGKST